MLFLLIMWIIFLLQDNAILLFLHLESLIKIFAFHGLIYALKYKLKYTKYLLYKILIAIVEIAFSQTFSKHIFMVDDLFLPRYIYL